MPKDSFLKDSFILTLSNLGTGILGFIFSILLSKKLGAEGMGLYGLVMPIYNLFICLICGGMVAAVSQRAAVYFSHKDMQNLNKTVEASLFFDLIWGIIIAFVVFILSSTIGNYIIKDERALGALKLICPAMVFVSLSSILKGYFYGISKVAIPAIIDIVEKAIRILTIYIVTLVVSKLTISKTVSIAYLALALGEFISFLLLYLCYRFYKHSYKYNRENRREGRAQLLFNIFVISLPLCLNGFLTTALSTISTLIVPRRLISAGFMYSAALSLIGKFNGMASNIVFFPMVVIGSITTILIPNLSKSLSNKDYYGTEKRISQVLQISFLIGLSTLIICTLLPTEMGKLFFTRGDLGGYINFISFSAPVMYCAVTTYAILNGIGKQIVLLRNSLICAVIEIMLLYTLTAIPSINIYGYGITLMVTALLALVLNLIEINKKCRISISLGRLILNLLLGTLIYFTLSILNKFLTLQMLWLQCLVIVALTFILIFSGQRLIKKFFTL